MQETTVEELSINENKISIRNVTYHVIKKVFDMICAIIGCLILIPVALIVKVVYVLNKDYDSIFLTQNRIGKNGREFKFYKFRTMIPNADEELKRLLETDEAIREEYTINKKLENDPRITKIGKILRKSSIDELPQFINVLKGDMSMIGNRPYLPREKEDMGLYFNNIVKTKPGITGYWQVSGRSNVTFQTRLELEKFYSNNATTLLDTKIFIKTFSTVIGKKSAK